MKTIIILLLITPTLVAINRIFDIITYLIILCLSDQQVDKIIRFRKLENPNSTEKPLKELNELLKNEKRGRTYNNLNPLRLRIPESKRTLENIWNAKKHKKSGCGCE